MRERAEVQAENPDRRFCLNRLTARSRLRPSGRTRRAAGIKREPVKDQARFHVSYGGLMN